MPSYRTDARTSTATRWLESQHWRAETTKHALLTACAGFEVSLNCTALLKSWSSFAIYRFRHTRVCGSICFVVISNIFCKKIIMQWVHVFWELRKFKRTLFSLFWQYVVKWHIGFCALMKNRAFLLQIDLENRFEAKHTFQFGCTVTTIRVNSIRVSCC